MKISRQKIYDLPKGDLHNHLILGASRTSVNKYLNKNRISFPKNYNGLSGMQDFIKTELNTRMKTKDELIKFIELAIEDCIADNVVYLEASIHLNLIGYFSDNVQLMIDAVSSIKNKYKAKIKFQPEIGIDKTTDIKYVYKYAMEFIDSGEFNSIDLYGPEKEIPIDDFIDLYKTAKKRGLKTKVHIGEFSDYITIDDAIMKLNPDEIQHGINAVNSKKLLDKIKERNIQLNICPKSNIVLGAVQSLKQHPIKQLYDSGIQITINTDDLLLFDSTVSDQYIMLMENDIFSFNEIDDIRKNSLQGL